MSERRLFLDRGIGEDRGVVALDGRPERLLLRYAGDILVYGHTHKAVIFRDPQGRLVVNPGAAGPRRFKLEPSVAILTVTSRTAHVEIVRLS